MYIKIYYIYVCTCIYIYTHIHIYIYLFILFPFPCFLGSLTMNSPTPTAASAQGLRGTPPAARGLLRASRRALRGVAAATRLLQVHLHRRLIEPPKQNDLNRKHVRNLIHFFGWDL